MLGFGCVVDLGAFEEHLKSNDDRVLVHRAYQIASFGVMAQPCVTTKRTEKVDFVFDDHGAAFDEAQRAFPHSGEVSLT
jgi:hypothetical protein